MNDFPIVNRTIFINRTYQDFQTPQLSFFTEMDTIHSSRASKKALLTFFFTREKLFLAFLMNRYTEGAVRLIFDRLKKRLGTYEFISIFEYLLTDRGSKFDDPDDWKQAYTMLLMILPKGTNFEFLTQ